MRIRSHFFKLGTIFKLDICFGMGAEEFLLRILHTCSFKVVTTRVLSHPSLQCPWWCPVSTVASTMQLHYHIQITIATSLPPTLCSSPRSAKFNCGLNTFKASNGRDVAVKQQNRAQSNWTKPSAEGW